MRNITIFSIKKLAVVVFIFLSATAVFSQVQQQFSPRFNQVVRGDFGMVANNVLSRTSTGNYNGNNDNHDYTDNVYVDIDNDNSTFNSSSANFTNPKPSATCLSVIKAYLYWAAADREPSTNGDNEPNWNYNDVKLMTPGQSNYTTITADEVIYRGRNFHFSNDPYICVKDITNLVQNLSTPFGKYQVANVEAKTGELIAHGNINAGTSGGWQIVFVYESPDLVQKNITVFDGYAHITSSQNNFNINFNGFQTISNGPVQSNVLIGGLEGDRDLSGDRLQIRNTSNNFVDIDAPQRDTNNFFNSRITVGNNNYIDRNPASTNTLGFDAALFSLDNSGNRLIANNQTSATFRMTSDQEVYGLYLLGLAIEVYKPDVSPMVLTTTSSTSNFDPEDSINFNFNIQNTGNDNVKNFILTTPVAPQVENIRVNNLPDGVTYTFNSNTLTFQIEDGLLDALGNGNGNGNILNLDFDFILKDECFFLEESCDLDFNLQFTASYTGAINPEEQTTISSTAVDECNVENLEPFVVNINQPSASWVSQVGELDRTIECNNSAELENVQALLPEVSCDNLTPIKTAGSFVSDGTCRNNGTYTNTFNFIDECGATIANYIQVITVEDTTGPEFTNPLPENTTVECSNVPEPANLQATDNCGTADVTFTETKEDGSCPGNYTLTRTWVATDQCDLTVSHTQTITVEDNTAPVFVENLPTNETVNINNIPTAPTLTATDACGTAEVVFEEEETGDICTGSYTIERTWTATDECDLTNVHTQTITVNQPTLEASIDTITNVLCNSEATGGIDITVNGGTKPYEFAWNDANNSTTEDLSNVIAGAYNVTITDANGCTTSVGATISEPTSPLSLNITKVDATTAQGCSNGQATAIVSGGSADYTYLWSASAGNATTAQVTGLADGTHSVTVTDANGCELTQSIVIECVNTCDAEIAITNVTDVLCTGDTSGSGTVTAKSNANPSATFTFTWSNGQEDTGVTTSTLANATAGVYSVSVTIDGTVCQPVEETIAITEPSNALNVTATTTDELGPATGDGTATAIVTGGVEPYRYAWSPGGQTTSSISDLSAGTYTVSVTDANNCTDQTTVTVNPGSCLNLSVTGTSTPAECFGENNGSINATVTGGSGNFTYAWDSLPNTTTAVNNLPAGDYTITVTDTTTQCTTSTTITVNEPNLLSSAIAVTNILCRDDATGSLDLAVNGGTAQYTFLWNNGAETEDLINVVAGTYSVTITDANGCTTTNSATIIEPDTKVSASITDQTNVDCFGNSTGQVTVEADGGIPPYSYSIDNGSNYQNNGTFSDLTEGSYNVIAVDANGCTFNQAITITEPSNALEATISSTTNVLCNSEATGDIDITVNGGTKPYDFAWNDANNSTTEDLSNVIAGAYNVTITDANGCTTSVGATISEPTSPLSLNITKVDATTAQGCSNGQATAIVSGGSADYTYLWSASAGNATTAQVTGLADGTHSVTVTDANGCELTQSIVIECVNTCDAEIAITNVTDVLCTGDTSGSGTVTAKSNANPSATFTFTWSNGQEDTGVTTSTLANATAGVYSVSVTIDGTVCQPVEETIAITEPSNALNVTATTTDELGPATGDGTATAIVTGGVEPYRYAWSPGGQTTSSISDLSAGTYTVSVTDANNCTDQTTVTVNPGSCLNLSVTGTSTPAECFGENNGSINATVTGGSGNFTYAWDSLPNTTTAVNNLPAGDYTITVTDTTTQCTTSTTITVNEPNLLSSAIAVTNILCRDDATGSLDLAVNGGTAQYTFLWNNGAETEDLINVVAGTYSVTITDANGCSTTNSATIIEPDTKVSASITDQTNVDCFGNSTGQVTVEADGGIPPYSYSIDNGSNYQNNGTFSDLTEGSYNVIAVDANGCTFNQIVEITTIPDITNPTIECPANISLEVTSENCTINGTEITLGTPITSDDCLVSSVTNDAPDTFPLGDTIVTWTVTDGSGNTTTCEQTVTIIDNIDPTFVECAAPVSVNVDANGCTTDIANIDLGMPTVDDNCTETTVTNDAPDTFPLGDTIVTWTVTDGSGNTTTCEQTVTIIDNIDPTFVECAAPVSVNVDANGCTTDIANIDLGTPTVDDNCTETTVTNDAPDTFPLGDTIVTWTVTDGSGNTTTCEQTVTIIDNIDPTFVECAAPVSVNVDANGCTTDIANIDLGMPTVDDNCTETTVTNDAPDTFPLGDTIVTWTVTDGSGNTTTCEQTVTIIDNIDPTFVECAAPVSVNVDANGCTTDIANIDLGMPTVDDNCTETTVTNDAPDTFPLGDTIVTWTVTDGSGNTTTCEQTVTIIDNIDPTFVECAAPVSVNVDANGCTTDIANIDLGTPTVDDNCTETTVTNDAPDTFPLGDTIVTWTVTDGSGNTTTCEQTVTIIDNIDPTFVECAAPVSVNVDANGCTTDIANIDLGMPTVDDNCTETTITNDAPDTFPLGDTIVTWTVTDGSGNTTTCEQTVTIIDNIDPTFVECAAPVSVNVDANGCTTDIANIDLGTPTVDDNCTETTVTNDAPDTFPLGDTIVTWTVTDGSGNTTTCEQTVTIIDNIDPTFVECAAPVSVNVDANGCTTDIANIDLGTPTVDDNCTETTVTNDAPDTFPLGDTIVTWTVTDGSGNTTTCEQTVTIIDNIDPTFVECAAPVSVNVDANGCTTDIANIDLGMPTVDDNCTETTVTNDAPDTFPLGDTIVTWTVTDGSGNTTTCEQTVTIIDNIDPTFVECAAPVSVNVDANGCTTDIANIDLGMPTVDDNCTETTVTNDAPDTFPLGDTIVTWTVTDGSGNTTTCEQTVTIIDNIDPTFVECAAPVSVNVDANGCTTDIANIDLGTPTVDDNCTETTVTNDAPDTFPLGDTIVTWTVTDGSGNTTTCEQTVTIIDNIDPTFVECAAPVSVNVDANGCTTDIANIDLGMPTVDDNCTETTITNDAPDTFPLGDTIVTWTVTDGSGNTTTCEQTVTIIDNIDPTFVECAAPVSVNVDANGCTTDIANIDLGMPTVDDNCTETTITNDAPDTFPLGDTIVTWTVTDGSGNTTTCEQTVTIIDNIDPTFVECAAPVSVNVDANGCTTDIANIDLGTPTVDDNCTETTVTNDAPDTFPLGDTIVTWTVTDGSGNTTTCEQTVTIIDNIDPTFVECAAPVSVNVDANGCTTDIANIDLGMPTVDDNCTETTVTNDAPDTFPLGDTIVTWTVTDGSGNTTTCEQTVTIIDNIDPTFVECAAPVSVNVDANGCTTDIANIDLGMPTVDDNCTETTVTNDAPDTFPLGDTIVTWTVTDGSGNTTTCEQTVTIIDNIDPTFVECAAPVSVNVDANGCTTDIANIDLGTPTVDDNCTETTVTNDAPDTFPLGDTIVTWTVTDGSGNTTTCEQTVTIIDNIDPTFVECAAPVSVNVDANGCTTDIANIDLGMPTVDDNCTETTITNDAPDTFPLGDTIVTWTVTDGSGNTTTCEQTVTIIDNIDPTFVECAAPVSVNVDANGCTTDIANIDLGTPTVDDNCTETTVTNDAPDTFPLGDTIVTWTVTDGSGNTTTCEQTVTIIDNIDPTFVECAAPVSVNVDANGCTTDIANIDLGTPTVDDNCTETTVTNDAPDTFPLGDTIVTWTVTDGSGNTTTCEQTVTIIDNIDPTFVECAAPVSVNVDANGCTTDIANIDLGMPTVDDNCTETTVTNDAPDTFPLGDTIVTWTVTDGSGNTTTCEQTVTIIDNIDPTFVECAAPVSVNVDANGCTTDIANIDLGMPTVDDNCTETAVTNDAPDTFPLGDTIVTWTVTDGSGNTTTCEQTVTIIDNIDPTFVECAAPVSVNVDANGCTTDIANIDLGTPTVDDNCTETTVTNDAPDTFPLGDTIVTWTVTDGSGNTTTCEQTVTIIDNIDPTFVECAAPVSVNVDANGCTTDIANIDLGTPTVDDNCTETTVTNDAPDTFPLGDTIVTWTVTDGSGNTTTCEQTVTVIDNIKPIFVECAEPVTVSIDANKCTTNIDNIDLGSPTVNDNCTETTITNDAPNDFPLGDTIVTWTVIDGSGNTATCKQLVTVEDNVNPEFVESLPEDGTYECDSIPTPAVLTASDPCGSVDVKFTETKIDGSCSGNYILERKWLATDQNGLITEHTQTITVQDTKAPQPTINISPSISINCDTIPEVPEVEFIDSCSSGVNVEFTETNSLDENNPSDYEIVRTWTVSDDCNNEQVYTQTITVTLLDFVSSMEETACSDEGTIDLNDYLSNSDLGGKWTIVEGNATLDDNLFDPANVELGTYKFSYGFTDGGCLTSVELNLELIDCIVYPCGREDVVISKVVTPNGDAYNEFFKITGVENCDFVVELQIFNRWGAKIYDNSDYKNNWNGFAHNSSIGKAEKVPNGTYFYIVNLKNSGLEPFAKAFYVGTK